MEEYIYKTETVKEGKSPSTYQESQKEKQTEWR